ncbi:MAG: MogA/MoaB family molybdenum cofactor biosynthesis protein [Hydrogenoanaerobacterium sp.]
MYRVAVVTLSDKGYAGEREDKSGELIREIMQNAGYEPVCYTLLPDDRALISEELRRICDNDIADLILTTGGTGFSARDITPEATQDIIERAVPGIPEAMRYASLRITPYAMLSRGTAGIRKKTLVVNLPGSPKAVRENLACALPAFGHGLAVLRGEASECARTLAPND